MAFTVKFVGRFLRSLLHVLLLTLLFIAITKSWRLTSLRVPSTFCLLFRHCFQQHRNIRYMEDKITAYSIEHSNLWSRCVRSGTEWAARFSFVFTPKVQSHYNF